MQRAPLVSGLTEKEQEVAGPALALLRERFLLVKAVGSGAHGAVIEAVRRSDGERVALKLSHRPESSSPDHEIAVAYALRGSQCVAGILGVERLVYNGEWVATVPVMPLYQSALACVNLVVAARHVPGWIRDILWGLQEMHSRGYVHLDLTPRNVFIRRGRAYIGDFGLSERVGDFTGPRGCAYVTARPCRAPELFANERSGFPADIWSAGCVAAFCLRGAYGELVGKDRYPYLGSAEEILKSVAAGPPALYGPDWLQNLVRDLLAPNPKERPSAREALARAVPDLGVLRSDSPDAFLSPGGLSASPSSAEES